jgi:uncharacterized membrane protein
MMFALIVVRILNLIDREFSLTVSFDPDIARTVLITLTSAMLAFVVFLSSALLIALQLASAQLTPRIIGLVFRDGITKISMTWFVFTCSLTLAAVLRISDRVPALTMYISTYSCVFSLALFAYLIDHLGKILRPVNALRIVARLGRDVIKDVYPKMLDTNVVSSGETAPTSIVAAEKLRETVVSYKGGVALACDVAGLVALARKFNCVLEFVPQIGDFIAIGDPLFRIYGGTDGPDPSSLRSMIALGHERSMEQDPAFAFRIMVDIASKALSPAINDPTTAVLALDQLQHLLGLVGRRQLDDERVREANGRTRLLCRTPGWDEFVRLAVTEVRQFGRESIQINRRLLAMLESLLRTLPAQRAPALQRELEVLKRSAKRSFEEPADQMMATEVDSQGVGGRHSTHNEDTHSPLSTIPGGDGRREESNVN